jgi:hypothetical protein
VFRSGVGDREVQLPVLVLFAAALAAMPKLFLFPRGGIDLLTALVSNVDGYYRQYFVAHPEESFAFAGEALRLARPFAMLLGLIGSGVWLLVGSGRRRLAFALLIAGLVPCLDLVDVGVRLVGADRSQRGFARVVEENWSADARLVVVGNYEDLCGVTYYTRRPTEMLEAKPQDLLWGFRKGDARELFLTAEKLQQEWNSSARVFVLSDKSLDLPGATVLAESPRDVLRTNHPLQVAARFTPAAEQLHLDSVEMAPRKTPPVPEGANPDETMACSWASKAPFFLWDNDGRGDPMIRSSQQELSATSQLRMKL